MLDKLLLQFSGFCFKTIKKFSLYFFWATLLTIPLAVGGWLVALIADPLLNWGSRRETSVPTKLFNIILYSVAAPVVAVGSLGVMVSAAVGGITSGLVGVVLLGPFSLGRAILSKIRPQRNEWRRDADDPFRRDRDLQGRGVLPAARIAGNVNAWHQNRAAQRSFGGNREPVREEDRGRRAESDREWRAQPYQVRPQPYQARRWDDVDEDVLIRQNVSRLLTEYNEARDEYARFRILNALESAYNQYRSIYSGPAHADFDVERVLAARRAQQANPVAESDEQKRAFHFQQLFRTPNAPQSLYYDMPAIILQGQRRRVVKVVMDRPFTNDEIKILKANLKIQESDDEATKIRKRLNKELFNAACNDEISADRMQAPIRLPNGKTYDLLTAIGMISTFTGEGRTPDRAATYTRADIIPNNTLCRAMQYAIQTAAPGSPHQEVYYFDEAKQRETQAQIEVLRTKPSYTRTYFIQEGRIPDFEGFYQRIDNARHQALFSLLCRDPLTREVIRDPVYLPDGYTYDRETVLAILHHAQQTRQTAYCPFDRDLPFTIADIKPCFSTRNILEEIGTQIALAMDAQAREEKAEAPPGEEQAPVNAEERRNDRVDVPVHNEDEVVGPVSESPERIPEKLEALYAKYEEQKQPKRTLLKSLSDDEVQRIQDHVAVRGAEIQAINQLFRAACIDMQHGIIKTPIRFRTKINDAKPSGDTLDLETASVTCPDDQQHLRLVPNNTLAIAYRHLIDAIDHPEKTITQREHPHVRRFLEQSEQKQSSSSRFFQPADVAILEAFYNSSALTPLQKQLFDDMCRDPITGKIFQDPVYLPDGKTYERSTAELMLQYSGNGESATIPDTDITFARSDIVTCNHTKKIMKTLKDVVQNNRMRPTATVTSTATRPATTT